jgi:hypothetical protein
MCEQVRLLYITACIFDNHLLVLYRVCSSLINTLCIHSLFILVDPSGTRDVSYSTSTNSYSWFYLQPLPWGKITGIIIFSAILIAVAVIEYRRRERKAALERYAERKRRRRFKLNTMTNEGEEDWKDFYHKQAISTKQINEVNNDGTTTSDLRVDMSSEQRHRRRQRRKQREEILLNKSNESEDDNDDINAEVRRNRRRLKPKIR